nr:PREDICTED: regulator of chromosome condensation isoform X2 [Bemisia tabaci]
MPVPNTEVRKGLKRQNSGPITGVSTKKFLHSLDFVKPVPRHSRGPGLVLAFGQGEVGQLGLGPDIFEKNKPAVVPDVDNIIDIYAGGMHTVCLTADGEVITWGCNDEGALGRETTEEGSETEPGKVDLPEKAVIITAGDSHSAALLESGRVFAWGSFRDSHGTMGLTPSGIQKVPVELVLPTRVLKLASGADHLALLTVDGQVYTCGCGEQGQLGRLPERSAQRNNRLGIVQLLTPAIVSFHPRLKLEFDEVWTGAYCTFAREKKKSKVYAFGLNNYNQLGLKNTKNHFHPLVSESLSCKKWNQISGGQHHTIALDNDGVTYAIGRKEYGRLGLGDIDEDALVPTVIPTLKDKNVVNIASGSAVSFAVSDDGEVWGWGMGTNNQLGTGDDEDLLIPTKISGKQLETRSVLQVSAGGQHTVLLAKNK